MWWCVLAERKRNVRAGKRDSVVSESGIGTFGALESAVRDEFAALAGVEGLAANGLLRSYSELAFRLAGSVDDVGTSATARSMCARALADLLGVVYGWVPESVEVSKADELAAVRAARRKAAGVKE